MAVNEELVTALQDYINILQDALNKCLERQRETIERERKEQESYGGRYKRLGVDRHKGGSAHCSSLENELQHHQDLLNQAQAGKPLPVPTSVPQPSPSVESAEQQANAQRLEFKYNAGVASDLFGMLAASSAAATAVSGFAALATSETGVGPLVFGTGALILGGESAICWYASSAFSALTRDPPRHDFQAVSQFTPFAFQLEAPGSEFEATWQDFAKRTVLLAVALEALTASLERYLGISDVLTTYQSMRYIHPDFVKEHVQYKIAQTQAVTDNATVCAQLVDALLHLRSQMNATWLELNEQLRSAALPAAFFTPQELGNKFAEQWKANLLSFQVSFRLNGGQMEEVMQQVEQMIQQQNIASKLPQTLLDEQWNEACKRARHSYAISLLPMPT